ncbi:MAG: diguanylate cyclase domain-containing protein [Comamonas sp.]
MRAGDHVARLGGDEFVVLLQGIDNLQSAQIASAKLVELISAPLTTLQGIAPEVVVHLGASIGIALYPHDALDAQALLKHADQQMYAHKAANRTQVHER